ncbi:hypothetical protein GCM10011362_28600 [Marinobacter halophilus]|nr:hypothetical protein GCM10011362_28600 [Marinobacter halophilus]
MRSPRCPGQTPNSLWLSGPAPGAAKPGNPPSLPHYLSGNSSFPMQEADCRPELPPPLVAAQKLNNSL